MVAACKDATAVGLAAGSHILLNFTLSEQSSCDQTRLLLRTIVTTVSTGPGLSAQFSQDRENKKCFISIFSSYALFGSYPNGDRLRPLSIILSLLTRQSKPCSLAPKPMAQSRVVPLLTWNRLASEGFKPGTAAGANVKKTGC